MLFVLGILFVLYPASAQADSDGIIQIRFTLDDEPIYDAIVSLYEDDDYSGDFEYDWDTGFFIVSTTPGTYDVEFFAYTSGVGSRTIRDVVVQAEQTTELAYELGPLVPVQVKVLFNGEPLPNVSVTIDDVNGGEVAYLEWDETNGSYIGEVTAHTWTLSVYPYADDVETKRIRDFSVRSDASNVFTVNLQPLQLLQIRLLAGSEPTADAGITLLRDGEHVDYARFNQDTGLWEALVTEGTYEAIISPYNFWLYDTQSVTVSTGEITTVQLGAETKLKLYVNSMYGAPYPFARVSIEGADDDNEYAYWVKEEQAYAATVLEGVYDIVIEPDGFYSPLTIAGVEFEGDAVELSVELIKDPGLTRVDISRIISQEELLAIAERCRESNLAALDSITRHNVEQQLKRLTEARDTARYKLVQEFSGSSIMFGAAAMEKELSLLFGATAVLAEPDDALILNNFGAVLLLAGSLSDAIQVLNYGRFISPESPLILTNLANALLEMGDDEQAEELLLQTLRHEPDFAEAHTSLASVYLARGNAQKAIDHIFMAAARNFTPAMRHAAQQAKDAGAKTPRPQQSAGPGASGGTEHDVPNAQSSLRIPRLPNWSTRDALNANAESLAIWVNDIISNGLTGPANAAWELYRSRETSPGLEKAYNGPYSQLVFEIECYNQYLQDRVMEIYDQFNAAFEAETEAWGEMVARITEEQVWEWEAAGQKMEEASGANIFDVARASLLEMDAADQKAGRERRAATDRYFVIWRDLFRGAYEDIARLVEEYWIYTESAAGLIFDPDTADYVHQLRSHQVYASFLPLAIELPFQMMSMEIGGFESLMRPLGEPLRPETVQVMETVQVPPPKKDSCPLRDGRSFNPDAGIISFKVTCETIEVKVGTIIKGSVTWNFKHKYVSSMYLGASTPGNGLVQVGAEGGLRANFGPNGEVLSVKPEGGFSGKIGGDTIGGMLSGGVSTGDGLVVNTGGFSRRL
jgi:tetratricopeptide (TPR) repeat protein